MLAISYVTHGVRLTTMYTLRSGSKIVADSPSRISPLCATTQFLFEKKSSKTVNNNYYYTIYIPKQELWYGVLVELPLEAPPLGTCLVKS